MRTNLILMRGKITLDKRKNSENINGFPIIFYLSKDSKKKIIRTGYRSKSNQWDEKNALPKKNHPVYIEILNYLEQKKITLAKLLEEDKFQNYNLHQANQYLIRFNSDVFYTEGLKVKGGRTYKIALNSFQKHFPDYSFDQITKKVVTLYMNILLNTPAQNKKRSPNGVISYLNTLTAIWNKLEKQNNPFSAIRPKPIRTKNKALTDRDIIKIRSNNYSGHPNSKGGGVKNYLNYFMLCFYLGGIDLGDLMKLKKENIINGRIEFYRSKGGTNVFVSNYIFPEAWEIINYYNGKDFLIPLNLEYKDFIPNISRYFEDIKNSLEISKKPYSKAPRYTFITRAQNLLIDERIVVQLVGHSQNSMHSVYKDAFPYHVIDEQHKKIIDL